MMTDEPKLLRHFLAALTYRTGKVLAGAPESFATFEAGRGVRTPGELVHHMSELFAHLLAAFRAEDPTALEPISDLDQAARRLYRLIGETHSLLATHPLRRHGLAERILQGPFADAMTHAGQLALLRRLAGYPVPAEDFFAADIASEQLQPLPPSE
jgi:hypothetical protein